MSRRASIAALAGLLVALGAFHLWWLGRFRDGFPLDIDESGYLWFAFVLRDRLREDGLVGLVDGFQHEGWVGPLLPAVTAVVPAGDGIVASLAVQLLFLAVLGLATYGIGTRLLDRRAGLLAALLTLTAPALLDFVRTYHLVVPSTALYAAATYALLASDRLRRVGWAVAWGIALGLALLSRSMMVAFLPALPLAAVWMLAVDRADRRRLLTFGLGLAAFVGTALLWYATSWRPILDYLLDFGYGEASPGHRGRTVLSPAYWTDELLGAVDLALYLPLAVALLAAVALAAAGGVAALARASQPAAALRSRLAHAARSDAIVPALVVAQGYVALTSSSNDGTGFVAPLLPSLVALVVLVALRVPWPAVRAALVASLALVAALNVLMKADVVAPVSEPRRVDVPLAGRLTLTNGRGAFDQHLVNDGCYELDDPTRPLPERERGWLVLFREAVEPLTALEAAGRVPRTELALSEPVLNRSAVRLAALRAGHREGSFEQVDTGGEDTAAAYRRMLEATRPDLLLVGDRQACHFGPTVTQPLVEQAAASLGYAVVRRLPMPDGRELRVWRRR